MQELDKKQMLASTCTILWNTLEREATERYARGEVFHPQSLLAVATSLFQSIKGALGESRNRRIFQYYSDRGYLFHSMLFRSSQQSFRLLQIIHFGQKFF